MISTWASRNGTIFKFKSGKDRVAFVCIRLIVPLQIALVPLQFYFHLGK